MSCPSDNTLSVDQSEFFTAGTLNWSQHRIGWALCGGAALLTTIVALSNIFLHCRNYRRPLQQRQVIRILLLPMVFAIISFAGFRFFREYVYFKLVRDTYEAFVIAAFFILLLLFLSDSPVEQREILATKEKRKMVFPLCCFRFRPSKPAFLHVVKWSVLQFVVVKPLISAAAVVTEALGLFCATSQSPKFANLWLEIADFVSVTIALYGLVLLYSLTSEELRGRRSLAKFSTIKIVVALVFYQNFVFSVLARYGVIKPTEYWTAHNVADGLNALVTSYEMLGIALFQAFYAFPYTEYRLEIMDDRAEVHTSFWRSFAHSQNYSDFAIDIFGSLKFFFDSARGKEYTKAKKSLVAEGGNDFDLSFDQPKTESRWTPKDEHEYPPTPYESPLDNYSNVSLGTGAGTGAGRAHPSLGAPQEYHQLTENERYYRA